MTPIETPRLVLRPWQDADRPAFFAMSADPGLQEFLRPLTTRDASDGWIDHQVAHQAGHGFCFWAVERRDDGLFVGSVGLYQVGYEAHFTPAVEVGWRIARAFWGLGYAPEAAAASLRHGFEVLHLPEVVANASVGNARSRRVMAKLGMTHDPADDFDHPRYPDGDPMRRQVLYRLAGDVWLARQADPVVDPWGASA